MPPNRVRQHTLEQRYAFVRLLNDIDATVRAVYGDTRAAAIVRTVWLGQQDGQLYDITSLAAHLNLPRQTVSYMVKRLVDSGVLERRRSGHSMRLRIDPDWPTSDALAHFGALMDKAANIFACAEALDPPTPGSADD